MKQIQNISFVKAVCIICCALLVALPSLSQTRFDEGFKAGFNKGYCYGSPVGGCVSPISPIPPVPGTDESLDSYQDGYNEGFLTGIDVQRMYAKYDKTSPFYGRGDSYYRTIIPHQFPDYQEPFSLTVFGSVLIYKEKMFEAGAKYIQNRIDNYYKGLKQIVQSSTPEKIESLDKEYDKIVEWLNSENWDCSDPSVIDNMSSHIDEVVGSLYTKYVTGQ